MTHDQAEALTMSDKIIVLNKGAIEQIGSPQDIYHHPKTALWQTLLALPISRKPM